MLLMIFLFLICFQAKLLSQEGGANLKDCTARICAKAIKRRVAKHFSLKGRAKNGIKKKTFIKLLLYKAIKGICDPCSESYFFKT